MRKQILKFDELHDLCSRLYHLALGRTVPHGEVIAAVNAALPAASAVVPVLLDPSDGGFMVHLDLGLIFNLISPHLPGCMPPPLYTAYIVPSSHADWSL